MTNLPEQAYNGGAVAVRPQDDPYAVDASMVTLPRLRIAQYMSDSFKRGLAKYGDLVVGIGKDDAHAAVVAKGADPLGEALRFYVHRLWSGYNYREDATDKRLTFGPLGQSFQQALQHTDGDPRRVFLKIDYLLTIPAYEDLPVRFLMTSKWGGPASKWLNTQISLIRQRGGGVLDTAFQIQTRSTTNNQGEFAVAEVGYADVKASVAKTDESLVQAHAGLAATINLNVNDAEIAGDALAEAAVDAPSLG